MPQDELIPSGPMVTGVHLSLYTPNPIDPGITAQVEVTWDNQLRATVFQEVYEGVMTDLLGGLATDVTHAFLYGERGAILKAAKSNRKVAKMHLLSHEY